MAHAVDYKALNALIEGHEAVILGSNLSDTRRIEQVLQGQFDQVCIERLDLAQGAEQAALNELFRRTGWNSLPMVFINGELVGGEWELTSQQQLGVSTCGRSTHGFANIIGYLGLIPFVALSILYSLTEDPGRANYLLFALVAYAAVILGFVGAIHWGRSLHEPHMVRSNLLQLVSMIPVLLAWLALLLPAKAGLATLIAGFVLLYLFDHMQYRDLRWMQEIRLYLSIGVVFSLLVSLLSAQKF